MTKDDESASIFGISFIMNMSCVIKFILMVTLIIHGCFVLILTYNFKIEVVSGQSASFVS